MSDIPGFLAKKDHSIVFNGEGEFIFYVPEKFFDTKNAVVIGEYVSLIGILQYAVFDKNGKHSGLKAFRLPTTFLTKPYTIEKMKDVQLTKNTEKQDYRALKYKKGDLIIVDENIAQDVAHIEDFYRLFIYGHIPNTIKYDQLQDYFMDNMRLNGNSYGTSMQLIGIIISESCRASKDLSKPFRLSKSNDMNDYQMVNIRLIPKYTSPFASITSENWDDAVVNAIITPNTKDSPMERILMT